MGIEENRKDISFSFSKWGGEISNTLTSVAKDNYLYESYDESDTASGENRVRKEDKEVL